MMLLMTTAATKVLVPQQSYEAPIYAGDTAPTVRLGPLRVRAFVRVRCPRSGRPRRAATW